MANFSDLPWVEHEGPREVEEACVPQPSRLGASAQGSQRSRPGSGRQASRSTNSIASPSHVEDDLPQIPADDVGTLRVAQAALAAEEVVLPEADRVQVAQPGRLLKRPAAARAVGSHSIGSLPPEVRNGPLDDLPDILASSSSSAGAPSMGFARRALAAHRRARTVAAGQVVAAEPVVAVEGVGAIEADAAFAGRISQQSYSGLHNICRTVKPKFYVAQTRGFF